MREANSTDRSLNFDPIINILKPHNIIFPQITPRLHLDDPQRNGAGVFQPVSGVQRDAAGLVFSERMNTSSPQLSCAATEPAIQCSDWLPSASWDMMRPAVPPSRKFTETSRRPVELPESHPGDSG